MLRRGQIVRLIRPGGSPITSEGIFPVGTMYTVVTSENADRLVSVRLLHPGRFTHVPRDLGAAYQALANRFELVEEEPEHPELYLIYNASVERFIGGINRDVYTYEGAMDYVRALLRTTRQRPPKYHLIPLRSVTKITADGTVTDYRENNVGQ